MARSHTAPAWRRAFLRELARSGNVEMAAKASRVSPSTPYRVRQANPAFAASWERALAVAPNHLAGATLEPDQIVRRSKAGRPCIAQAGPGRWSVAAEQAFLAALTASANVKAAARAAGVSPQAAYARRRQWPGFAAAWDAARAEGWLRLEMLLIAAATATLEPEPEAAAAEDWLAGPAMSVEQALQLWFHRPGARDGAGGGRWRGHAWRQQEPDIEAVRAEVLRRVAAIERARGEG